MGCHLKSLKFYPGFSLSNRTLGLLPFLSFFVKIFLGGYGPIIIIFFDLGLNPHPLHWKAKS